MQAAWSRRIRNSACSRSGELYVNQLLAVAFAPPCEKRQASSPDRPVTCAHSLVAAREFFVIRAYNSRLERRFAAHSPSSHNQQKSTFESKIEMSALGHNQIEPREGAKEPPAERGWLATKVAQSVLLRGILHDVLRSL